MKSIKYNKSKHEKERFTKWLNRLEESWIFSEMKRMKIAKIETYIVKNDGKFAICHVGYVKPQISF